MRRGGDALVEVIAGLDDEPPRAPGEGHPRLQTQRHPEDPYRLCFRGRGQDRHPRLVVWGTTTDGWGVRDVRNRLLGRLLSGCFSSGVIARFRVGQKLVMVVVVSRPKTEGDVEQDTGNESCDGDDETIKAATQNVSSSECGYYYS